MIYLDNAATTKPNEQCLEQAKKYLYESYYNPSALYAGGYNLQLELKSARKNILSTIANEGNYELIFTSCGTEADNHAVFCGGRRGNIVTTEGEHSAIFSSVNQAKQRGIEVRFAKLNADGSVNVQNLLSLVDEKTSLVSVIHVNNETGAINDINNIAKQVKYKNKYTLFHSDGVQAFGKIPFRMSENIDLYSISAHKIGGIKGVGALFKRKTVKISPYIYGGGQESGMRSGTENVFGIKMLEFAALKKYASIKENYQNVDILKGKLAELLDKELFTVLSGENSSPYILSVAVEGVRGETILHEVDDRGLIIGTGSACSSNEKKRHSRVMMACGVKEELLDGILRLSFSSDNTLDEVSEAAKILNSVVKNRKEIMS
jgi:cysteine desulfurase